MDDEDHAYDGGPYNPEAHREDNSERRSPWYTRPAEHHPRYAHILTSNRYFLPEGRPNSQFEQSRSREAEISRGQTDEMEHPRKRRLPRARNLLRHPLHLASRQSRVLFCRTLSSNPGDAYSRSAELPEHLRLCLLTFMASGPLDGIRGWFRGLCRFGNLE